jgi:hypothetical protein
MLYKLPNWKKYCNHKIIYIIHWLRGPGCNSRQYQIFWEVVVLEQGPLSLVSTIEELLGIESSGSCPENQEYTHRNLLWWSRNTLYLQKLTLTLPTSGSLSVGTLHLWIKATEFVYFVCYSLQVTWLLLLQICFQ